MHVTTMASVVVAVAASLFVGACSGSSEPVAPAPTSLPAPAAAAAGTVSGVLTNATGERVRGAVFVHEGARQRPNTSTNAAGEYALEGVGPGRVVLRAASRSYQDAFVEVTIDGNAVVDFTLQPLPKAVLSGKLTDVDTGTPIAGATVTVLPDPTTDATADWGRTATTDSGGIYRFDDITEGGVNIAAVAPGYQEWRTGGHIRVRPTMDLQLRKVAAPDVFVSRIGWQENSTCIWPEQTSRFQPVQYPCAGPQFTMRRPGGFDVTLTWEAAAPRDIVVHVIRNNLGITREVRSTGDTSRTLIFSENGAAAGAWSIRVVDMGNSTTSAAPPTNTRSVPFRLTLTRRD